MSPGCSAGAGAVCDRGGARLGSARSGTQVGGFSGRRKVGHASRRVSGENETNQGGWWAVVVIAPGLSRGSCGWRWMTPTNSKVARSGYVLDMKQSPDERRLACRDRGCRTNAGKWARRVPVSHQLSLVPGSSMQTGAEPCIEPSCQSEAGLLWCILPVKQHRIMACVQCHVAVTTHGQAKTRLVAGS